MIRSMGRRGWRWPDDRRILDGPGHGPAELGRARLQAANLAAAQELSQKAWEKISAAQQANEFDMGGHAAKAKELLDQVNRELKMAAEAANKNGK